ncbi:MAG: hypothetical protein HOP01_03685 [Gallionella sp.]|nr:hypothetical protein [Gallionella sp.]
MIDKEHNQVPKSFLLPRILMFFVIVGGVGFNIYLVYKGWGRESIYYLFFLSLIISVGYTKTLVRKTDSDWIKLNHNSVQTRKRLGKMRIKFPTFGLRKNVMDREELNNSTAQKELQSPKVWLFCISLFFIFSYSGAYKNFDITSLWKLAKLSLITVLQVFCMVTAISGAAFRLIHKK